MTHELWAGRVKGGDYQTDAILSYRSVCCSDNENECSRDEQNASTKVRKFTQGMQRGTFRKSKEEKNTKKTLAYRSRRVIYLFAVRARFRGFYS